MCVHYLVASGKVRPGVVVYKKERGRKGKPRTHETHLDEFRCQRCGKIKWLPRSLMSFMRMKIKKIQLA